MKRLCILIFTMGVSILAGAQQIEEVKFWIDGDFPNASIVGGPFTSEISNINFPTNNLSGGFHNVSYMFRQTDGKWSVPLEVAFFKVPVNLTGNGVYEFWVDTLFSQRKSGTYASTYELILNSEVLDIRSIPNGFHTFYIRYKPNGSLWSNPVQFVLFKKGNSVYDVSKIQKLQYWFDDNSSYLFEREVGHLSSDTNTINFNANFLATGGHKLSYHFIESGHLSTSVVEDSFLKIPVLNYSKILPKILTYGSTVITPNSIRVVGKDFYPMNLVRIFIITGKQIISDTTILTSIEGTIDCEINTINVFKSGEAAIQAYDTETTNYSNIQRIYIQNSTELYSPTIQQLSPRNSDGYFVNTKIPVQFNEHIERLSTVYPFNLSGNLRACKYRVFTSTDSSTWQLEATVEGYAKLNTIKSFNKDLSFSTPGIYYIKVEDAYLSTNSIGCRITVQPTNEVNFEHKLLWDNSFDNTNNLDPKGVCADGASRLYINVSKMTTSPIVALINKVKVELLPAYGNNYNFSTTATLGKVLPAISCNSQYNEEANVATNLVAEIDGANCGNSFRFWFVAPDDFNQGFRFGDYRGYRITRIKISVTYENNVVEEKEIEMQIMRPPLILAHGLASSPVTWNEFSYSKEDEDGDLEKITYINSKGNFNYVKAINLCATCSFDENAKRLIGKEYGAEKNENSIVGVIASVRKGGFACNRVDYVGHSMGGVVLRYLAGYYSNLFLGTSPDYPFRNYGKGFVNKFITIGTPHNSSPVADILNKIVSNFNSHVELAGASIIEILDIGSLFGFIEVDYSGNSNNFLKVTDAIKNLQVLESEGGVNLPPANIKHHMIAGQLFDPTNEFANNVGSAVQMLFFRAIFPLIEDVIPTEIIYYISKYNNSVSQSEREYYVGIIARLIAVNTLDPYLKTLEYFKFSLEINNYENIFINSDGVVPVNSQLAGMSESDPNVTIFRGVLKNHLFQTSNDEIGTRVHHLLNAPIQSELFGNSISATNNRRERSQQINLQRFSDSVHIAILHDTTKFKIVNYERSNCNLLLIDSTVFVKLKLYKKDSVISSGISYIGTSAFSAAKADTVNLKFQHRNYYKDTAVLYAFSYVDSAGTLKKYYDSVKICQMPPTIINKFAMMPNVFYGEVNDKFALSYFINSDSSIKQISRITRDLNLRISDTAIADFIEGNLIHAKKIGTTQIIAEFQTFSDTGYIYIRDSVVTLTPLPVKLMSFDVSQNTCNSLNIEWHTTHEFDLKEYILESSGDGINYLKEETIIPKNINDGSRYFTKLNDLHNGIHLLRLKTVENDGSFSYSHVRKIIVNCEADISFAPNPVKDEIQIIRNKNDRPLLVKIIDVTGKIVLNESNFISNHLNLKHLVPGSYFIQFDNQPYQKFIKQ